MLPALRAGAEACISKVKIDHRRFISTLSEAARKRKRQLALTRGTQQSQQAYRFGGVTIRGQRFIRAISTGSIASVYLAESERAGAIVVLKVLRKVPDQDEGHGTFDRFLQEYEVVSKISHPNVVRIYDLGVADDHAYIAMEYFPAGDLRARIARERPSSEETLIIVGSILAALTSVHEAGIIHRDLKPANVMFREDGTIALVDFGSARRDADPVAKTLAGVVIGTPYYLSPEQALGGTADERSDLYSVGVMFYELLTGQRMYAAGSLVALFEMHKTAPIPKLPGDLSRHQRFLERLVAKKPDERRPRAGECYVRWHRPP